MLYINESGLFQIPDEVREQLGISSGDWVELFPSEDGEIVIQRVDSRE